MVVFEPQGIQPAPIPDETRAEFTSPSAPAWCTQILDDQTLQPIATRNRTPKTSTQDSLIAETLATDNTIRAWQSFYKPLPLENTSTNTENDATSAVAGELVSLLSLGRGANGHADVLHGGIVVTIADDTMGMVARAHRTPNVAAYTAYMTVQFRRPVPTPGVILCRTWLERRSRGRKMYLRARVEDGEGGLFAEVESLWVEVVSDKHNL